MWAIDGNVEHHKLVRKDDVCVEEDPPDQQHQKVQGAEVEFLFLGEMRTESDRRHEGHNVDEKNYVPDKRFRKTAAQKHFVERPQTEVG